jgi:hypothetical protein
MVLVAAAPVGASDKADLEERIRKFRSEQGCHSLMTKAEDLLHS